VIAREAVLSDPDVVALLRKYFIAIAVDNVANPNLTPSEREFLSDKGLKASTHGMSVFTAGGRVLATGGVFQPGLVKDMLMTSLRRYQAVAGAEPKAIRGPAEAIPEEGRDALSRPPEGGLVLFVSWKVVGRYGRTEPAPTTENGKYDQVFRDALGVDRLWVRKDEADDLARGTFPESLKMRMIPHFSDSFVGKVEDVAISFQGRDVTGSLRSDTGDRGDLRGIIASKEGRVTHFDVVAKGWGERVDNYGAGAGLTVVPRGKKVPVAVLFTLADPRDDLSKVPPKRCKDDGYLR
jgi:hypothetical protein